ncbi:myosin light chain kinase, smooth muscle-like [Brienomyrus brachyistius]|uniref:myosin light chain kinase, smooth muscle-like n=1 Tax=Brienomyrus brachyistius TaxID=42636 RepID=UPI0020B41DF7|nr:myosin light chain kinase, smooth muscle-like [Brienomyrus brachyistius]XP_048847898.1 myosin light chain kinase, smooth muscle-like [Brienomyrus brachyistius]XP_048847899.1 myosin light chain kinase, smooth muscle-like [Brienomyrus brachyistius]
MFLKKVSWPRRPRSPIVVPEVPYFLLPPRNAAVRRGDKATFYIKVQGNPEPSVRFFHDGAPVDSEAPPFSLCRLGWGVHVFNVANASRTVAGRYTCEVTNSAGGAKISFRLELKDHVNKPVECSLRRYHSWGESHPRFVTKPRSMTVKEGERVEFKARITGRPPPSVSWLKDSFILHNNSEVHSSFSAGFHLLELDKVRMDDQGLYTCRLSSLAGVTSASAQLTVTDGCPCVSPILNCARQQIHVKATAPVQESPSAERILGNGPIVANSPCKNRTRPAKKVAEDYPRPGREPKPPQFTEPLEDCTVDEGRDMVLGGVVTGSQPISISWLHNGESTRFGIPSFDGSVAKLVVRECLPEDAGAYTCMAENRVGKTSSSAAVCVRDFETICGIRNKKSGTLPVFNCIPGSRSWISPVGMENSGLQREQRAAQSLHTHSAGRRKGLLPKARARPRAGKTVQFHNPPKELEVHVGETAHLSCRFHSDFPVAVCWTHNREQVVNGPRVWVESKDKQSVLVVTEAQYSDVGKYTIVVQDRQGPAYHTATLTVIDRPQPPACCPVVSQLSGSSLVLSWSGPCYDGGSAIVGYVVEARKEGPGKPGDWSEVTSRCRSTSYRLRSGLEPEGEYRFRVRAYNTVGLSRPSQETEIIKMDVEGQPLEAHKADADITIDMTNKVTDHYNVMEKLGVGKFGQVFRLVHKETGQVCAGKFYKGRRAKEREAARREIELMKSLQHPKLVQCLGAYEGPSEVVMVMEYVAGGELFARIVDDKFEHTEPASMLYMRQILEGVGYMHQQSIVHLDLKPENIVCVNSTGTLVKIIDFGLASKLDPNKPLKVMHGTPEFVAPEVINFEPVGLTTDMWSVGVICYLLLSGESPFQGESDLDTLARVTAAQLMFSPQSFEEISDQAKDFIKALLRKDSRRRLSCSKALSHPWMAASVPTNPRYTKTLSKEKMKKYLAKQKWKKTGKAVLAVRRLAVLSNKTDGPSSFPSPGDDPSLYPEMERVLKFLEEQLQSKPWFSQVLTDQTQHRGATARLTCHIQGYPDPEVVWLQDEEPLEESARTLIEYEEDGRCALILGQLEPADAGLYTCKASNSQGEALCSARLWLES